MFLRELTAIISRVRRDAHSSKSFIQMESIWFFLSVLMLSCWRSISVLSYRIMSKICQLHAGLKYYMCMHPVDMRKQFQGLQGIVNEEFDFFVPL